MPFQLLDREEQERRRHIRQWARFMIAHLEGRDETKYLGYTDTLVRLQSLLADEIERSRFDE